MWEEVEWVPGGVVYMVVDGVISGPVWIRGKGWVLQGDTIGT